MSKEYRVDCVLTERERALLVALRCNIHPNGVSGEIYSALAKITRGPNSKYDYVVSRTMYSALDGGAVEIPDFTVPVPIVVLPLNDEYTATVNPDGSIKVGCQTIQFESLERVYEGAKRAKGLAG